MTRDFVLLGRQPILDAKRQIFGYELLFRDAKQPDHAFIEPETKNLLATARVLVNALQTLGPDALLGGRPAFINVDHHFLQTDLVDSLPPQHFIFELLEHTQFNEETVLKVVELREKGYRFALDDFLLTDINIEKFKPIFRLVDFLKVDLRANLLRDIVKKTVLIQNMDMDLLIEKVEREEEFKLCREIGYSFFQGHFFAKPILVRGMNVDPDQLTILELIGLLQQDAEINEIVAVFNKQPLLGLNLLKFINSAGMGVPNPIQSIEQAIQMLGRKQLTRWLMLLAYAGPQNNPNNPLLELATMRAQFMSIFIADLLPNERSNKAIGRYQDAAFLTGLISLMDVLFKITIEELLEKINIDMEIRRAILQREGLLGEVLQLGTKVELNEIDAGDLADHGIDLHRMADVCQKSFAWVQAQGF